MPCLGFSTELTKKYFKNFRKKMGKIYFSEKKIRKRIKKKDKKKDKKNKNKNQKQP